MTEKRELEIIGVLQPPRRNSVKQPTQEKRGTEEGILNFEHKPFQFPEKLIHIGSAQY